MGRGLQLGIQTPMPQVEFPPQPQAGQVSYSTTITQMGQTFLPSLLGGTDTPLPAHSFPRLRKKHPSTSQSF